jgi:hypothetical protein
MTETTEGTTMAHVKTGATRAEATSPEWLQVGAQIGTIVNEWAFRSDLVAYVGPGAGGPAPACFNPELAEIEVNVDIAFGKSTTPALVGDLTKRSTQFEWPKASGAIYHEALHARFSRWSLAEAYAGLADNEAAALTLLEESRIEKYGVEVLPANAAFLRACALEIVLHDAEENLAGLTSTRAAAQLAGLTLARVDAGVLQRSDVAAIADVVETFLGEDLLQALRALWIRYQDHDNHYNVEMQYDTAREWVRLVEDAAAERGEPGAGEPGQEEEFAEFMKTLMDALGEDAEATGIAAQDDIDEQEQSEEWAEQVSSKAGAAKERKEHVDAAAKVFGRGTGPSDSKKTNSVLKETRKPSSAERAAAVKVATMLEKAKYRERDAVDVASVLPPGRLRTRAMVQGAALKAKGVHANVEPWRRTMRKHTDDPTLSVGVMVDISGSMGAAMEPMAVTAWVMSEATRRVQGKCAMVYYGNDVFPTLKSGQHLADVAVYSAADGTEKFDDAFKSLNGAMNLLHGSGARLLVIVSDGHYTSQEQKRAKHWMQRCQESGVAVLWLFGTSYVRSYLRGTDGVVLEDISNPADAATEIGKAAAAALSKVGQRNAS